VDAGAGWNPANGHVYEMRLQWLGSGHITLFTDEAESLRIQNANTIPVPYIKTAMLPISFDAVGAGVLLKNTCTSVSSEGGEVAQPFPFSISRSTDLTISGNATTFVPVISLRVGANIAGVRSRILTIPTSAWCVSDSKRIRVKLIVQPSVLTGAVFTGAGTGTTSEYDETATAYSGGIEIGGFAVPANGFDEQDLSKIYGEDLRKMRRRAFSVYDAGTALDIAAYDTITISAVNPSAGNATVNCGFEYQEIR